MTLIEFENDLQYTHRFGMSFKGQLTLGEQFRGQVHSMMWLLSALSQTSQSVLVTMQGHDRGTLKPENIQNNGWCESQHP